MAEAEAIERQSDEQAQTAPSGAEANEETGEARRAPVSEAKRYRKRAQAAEARLEELRREHASLADDLQQTRAALDAAERRRRVDELLVEAETIDLEAARLLTEAAVEQMDEADVDAAVEDLRRQRPYLFRPRQTPGAGVMGQRERGAHEPVVEAAETAATSGNRRDLLRYLRLRRGA